MLTTNKQEKKLLAQQHQTTYQSLTLSAGLLWLPVFGTMQMAQCIWHNGENNHLGFGWGIGLGSGLGLGLGIGIWSGSGFDYFRHCAICIAPNTESRLLLTSQWKQQGVHPQCSRNNLYYTTNNGQDLKHVEYFPSLSLACIECDGRQRWRTGLLKHDWTQLQTGWLTA